MTVADYIEYAEERGHWWSKKYPHLRDDILATALLALVKAFASGVRKKNPKGYISGCIDNEIRDFLAHNYLIYIPKQEIKRRKKAKESLDDLPRAFLIGDLRGTLLTRKLVYDDYKLWDLGVKIPDHPVWKRLHAEDVLSLLELSNFERELVRMRMEDRSLAEISILLDRPKTALHEALEKIRIRYRRIAYKRRSGILRPKNEE